MNNEELSSFSLSSFDGDDIYFWDNELSSSRTYTLSYTSTQTVEYYDNDEGAIISKIKPNTTYNLSDLLGDTTTTPIESFRENIYNCSGEYIYSPIDVVMDFRNLTNFSTYIPPTEPIYKIEYFINGVIKTQYILENSQINFDDIYNTTFQTSPINMEYISFKIDSPNFDIIFYSLSGKAYTFGFNFSGINFSLSDKYNKLELLDVRIRDNTNDQQDCLIYLNTRKPDTVINTTILNI